MSRPYVFRSIIIVFNCFPFPSSSYDRLSPLFPTREPASKSTDSLVTVAGGQPLDLPRPLVGLVLARPAAQIRRLRLLPGPPPAAVPALVPRPADPDQLGIAGPTSRSHHRRRFLLVVVEGRVGVDAGLVLAVGGGLLAVDQQPVEVGRERAHGPFLADAEGRGRAQQAEQEAAGTGLTAADAAAVVRGRGAVLAEAAEGQVVGDEVRLVVGDVGGARSLRPGRLGVQVVGLGGRGDGAQGNAEGGLWICHLLFGILLIAI